MGETIFRSFTIKVTYRDGTKEFIGLEGKYFTCHRGNDTTLDNISNILHVLWYLFVL